MKLTNVSACEAAWMPAYEPDGREMLIVIAKATFRLPLNGEEAEPLPEPVALVQADSFTGEPGLSAPLHESDFAHRKPFCDVVVVGSAYAPPGKAVRRLQVGVQVAGMVKQFAVVGDREWSKGLGGVVGGDARPFAVMPISYDVAYGGTDRTSEAHDGKVFTYTPNPVGRGYWKLTDQIDGKPLPSTEALNERVTAHTGSYQPMSLSPTGRNWSPRAGHAGTYDQEWLDNDSPFWPKDFDYRYFQSAATDQWIPYPRGGEAVVLQNLTPDGLRSFRLPVRRMPVTFIPYRGRDVTRDAVLDTIVLEPDHERFTLTWRTSLALGKSVFDVEETIVGEKTPGWHRARLVAKEYYPGLAALVAARRGKATS
jgi:hypothetical protein